MDMREEETRGCTWGRRKPGDAHEGGGDQWIDMREEETRGCTWGGGNHKMDMMEETRGCT